MDFFSDVTEPVGFAGPAHGDGLAYQVYDPDRMVAGKRMEDHLRVAVCYCHSFNWPGSDVFGTGTFDRPWLDGAKDPMQAAVAKQDAAFEFFDKLGTPWYCFHDSDMAPPGVNLKASRANLGRLVDRAGEKMQETGVGLLWGTANLFAHPRYAAGAATNPDPKVFAYAVAQVRDRFLELVANQSAASGSRARSCSSPNRRNPPSISTTTTAPRCTAFSTVTSWPTSSRSTSRPTTRRWLDTRSTTRSPTPSTTASSAASTPTAAIRRTGGTPTSSPTRSRTWPRRLRDPQERRLHHGGIQLRHEALRPGPHTGLGPAGTAGERGQPGDLVDRLTGSVRFDPRLDPRRR